MPAFFWKPLVLLYDSRFSTAGRGQTKTSCARWHAAVLLLLSLAVTSTPALAEQPNAVGPRVAVTGTVTDTSGAALSGASIEARVGGRTVATATTGADGRYHVELTPGTLHELRVRREGFSDETVDVQTGSGTMTRDISLRIATLLDTVVVTASRTPETLASTTASVSVFNAGDVAALGSTSLADIVRMVPGLAVESTGREGALTSLFSRGGESDYNLVLIDGVRVNASGGQFDFSRVSGGEIERVEVVRGAQSALYGSDAIGAVVQIFTRRTTPSDTPRLFGSLEGGSFNTWRGNLRVIGGARGRIDYQAGVTYRGTDGAFKDILPERDRYDQPAFDGAVGVGIGGRATLRTGLRVSTARGRFPGPIVYGARDTGTSYETNDRSWHLDFAQRLASRLNHTATFAYFRSSSLSADRTVDPPYQVYAVLEGTPGAIFPKSPRLVRLVDQAVFNALRAGSQPLGARQFLANTPFGAEFGDFPFTSKTEFRRPALKYQADLTWHDGQVLTGGYEYEREKNPLSAGFRVENNALFAQQEFKLQGRWFATVGGRLDHNTHFGNSFSPKLSVGGFALPFGSGAISSVKVFSNLGRGIKNPTFIELFGSAFVDGNLDLHPERARTMDLGAELTFKGQQWRGRVTYFDNRYNDQVAFRSTGFGLDGKPDYLNIDGSKAHGWELEGGLQRPVVGFRASAGYSFVETKVVAFVSTSEQFQPGQPLLHRPKQSAMLRLNYVRGRAAVDFNLRHVGQRHDAAFLGLSAVPSPQFPNGESVDITVNPAYTLIGIGGDFRVNEELTLYLRIDNLTDKAYESALGYPGLPRAVVAGGRFSIGRR